MRKQVETGKKRKSNAVAKKAKKQSVHGLVLHLYITGSSPQSTRALVNLKRILEQHVDGDYDLEVVDIYQRPDLAREQQIIAAPTLVKMSPLPLRRLVGDMSDEARVLRGLGLEGGIS